MNIAISSSTTASDTRVLPGRGFEISRLIALMASSAEPPRALFWMVFSRKAKIAFKKRWKGSSNGSSPRDAKSPSNASQ